MSIVLGLLAAAVVVLVGVARVSQSHRVLALTAQASVATPADRDSRARSAVRCAARRVVPLVAVSVGIGPLAGAVVVVSMMVWPRVGRVRSARHAARQIAASYPDFIDLLVLGIKAGCSAVQALEALADVVPPWIRRPVTRVIHLTATGQRFADAIGALGDDPPGGLGAIARPLADALALADRYGTPLPPILDRLSDEARAQRRRNAEAAARQLPIHLSFPLVGCTLPSFVLLTIVPLLAGTFSSLPGFSR